MRKGFSLLEIVVVLAIVTGLLGGAIWAWRAQAVHLPKSLAAPAAWEHYLLNARQLAQARGRPVLVAVWANGDGMLAHRLVREDSEWRPVEEIGFNWSGGAFLPGDEWESQSFNAWPDRGAAQVMKLHASGQPLRLYTWQWADNADGRWAPGGLPQHREIQP